MELGGKGEGGGRGAVGGGLLSRYCEQRCSYRDCSKSLIAFVTADFRQSLQQFARFTRAVFEFICRSYVLLEGLLLCDQKKALVGASIEDRGF